MIAKNDVSFRNKNKKGANHSTFYDSILSKTELVNQNLHREKVFSTMIQI